MSCSSRRSALATHPSPSAQLDEVTSINLQGQALSGPIPPEWGAPEALRSLQNLYLQVGGDETGSDGMGWETQDTQCVLWAAAGPRHACKVAAGCIKRGGACRGALQPLHRCRCCC